LSFRASEARPGIQSRLERDSKNSGFWLRGITESATFASALRKNFSDHDLITLKAKAGRKQDLSDVEHLQMILER
jgi:hypothetical protein